jgi:hypothetical protein
LACIIYGVQVNPDVRVEIQVSSNDKRVAYSRFWSFLLTASIDERIPLPQYTITFKNEGAPRVAATRGVLNLAVRINLAGG